MATISQPADEIDSLDSSSTPTRREKIAATSLNVCGFLAFYLLSAGPVAGIHNVMNVRAFRKAVEVIYKPIVLLVESNLEPFSSIMKWYISLFRQADDQPTCLS